MSQLPALYDDDFDGAIEHGNWVVEFWSPTCSPCRIVSPALEVLARELPGVHFAAVNVDAALRTALRNHMLSVPAVVLYQDGRPVDVMISSYPPSAYRTRILAQFGLSG